MTSDVDPLFITTMNFYNYFRFTTPDVFCVAYANRYGCDILPADLSCLGPVYNGENTRFFERNPPHRLDSPDIWKDGLHPAWAADKLWAEGLFKQLSLIA